MKTRAHPAREGSDQLDEFVEASKILDLLAKLSATSAENKGYVVVSRPAANTQGFEVKAS